MQNPGDEYRAPQPVHAVHHPVAIHADTVPVIPAAQLSRTRRERILGHLAQNLKNIVLNAIRKFVKLSASLISEPDAPIALHGFLSLFLLAE